LIAQLNAFVIPPLGHRSAPLGVGEKNMYTF